MFPVNDIVLFYEIAVLNGKIDVVDIFLTKKKPIIKILDNINGKHVRLFKGSLFVTLRPQYGNRRSL